MITRLLSIGTFWKILLANAVIVAASVVLTRDMLYLNGSGMSPSAAVIAVTLITLIANGVVLRVALAPLTELEYAAQRVAGGDLHARAQVSAMADHQLVALADTFNRMVESVAAQRALGRDVASEALADADEARRRLSRDLREDSAQMLTSALLQLRVIPALEDASAREQAVEEVRASVTTVAEKLRCLAAQLRPSALDLLGVDEVIEGYAKEAVRDTKVQLTIAREPLRGVLAPEAEMELLRVVRSVLDRALLQASSLVRLSIARNDWAAIVTIQRDGRGMVFQGTPDMSLFALRERASYFGGSIETFCLEGECGIRVRFPINQAA